MKTTRFLQATLYAVIIIAGTGFSTRHQQAVAEMVDAVSALDSVEKKMAWIDYRIGLEEWQRHLTGRSDSLEFFRRLRKSVAGEVELYEALRGSRSRLPGEIERRRYDLIYPLVMRTRVDLTSSVRGLVDSLADFFSHDWCNLGDRTISVDRAREIMSRGRRRSQRELAFRAMSEPGDGIERQMARLFRLRNQAARRMGYNDYFSLTASLARFEVADYRRLLDQIDSITRPGYESIHRQLQTSMGEDGLEVWDWEQRFENTVAEADRFFPADSQMIYLRRLVGGIGFDLDNLPVYWQISADSAASGAVEVIVIKAPHDIRIVADLANGMAGFRSLLGAVGLALNSALSAQESDLLARPKEPAWSEAISSFFESLIPEAGLWAANEGSVAGLQTRLSRATEAIELFRLRQLLVDARFEYEAYRDPNRNLNELYWELLVEYTGLHRHDDLAPWAGKEEYLLEPLTFYHRLQGRTGAAQNLSYLRAQYGRIVDNREMGSFLTHNYFRFGSRYDWRELVERATGEPLTPTKIVSY